MLLYLFAFILGLQPLHEAGYRGEGKTIAVIDCGFFGADSAAYFPQEQIIASYDLIEDSLREYSMFGSMFDNHGTKCLSTMLYRSEQFTGTAPDAQYILIRSEELSAEHRREVDRLARAIYLADSLGADIITISLGYNNMDDMSTAFSLDDLDGSSSASRAATAVAGHNRLVCIAAGNYGNRLEWEGRISIPGDADSVLTVGAIAADSTRAAFSGCGPTADGRIKPDVVAPGQSVEVFDPASAMVDRGNGTSFATPEIAGMAACLWQALPDLTAMQLRELILRSATQYDAPNDTLGYGIPNAWTAYRLVEPATGISATEVPSQCEKILYGGHLYIVRDGLWFDAIGRRRR